MDKLFNHDNDKNVLCVQNILFSRNVIIFSTLVTLPWVLGSQYKYTYIYLRINIDIMPIEKERHRTIYTYINARRLHTTFFILSCSFSHSGLLLPSNFERIVILMQKESDRLNVYHTRRHC